MEAFVRRFKAVCAGASRSTATTITEKTSVTSIKVKIEWNERKDEWERRNWRGMRNEGMETRWSGRVKRWPMRLEGMYLDEGGNTVTDVWTDIMKDRCQVMAGRWREAGDRYVVSNLPRVMEQTQGGVYFSQDFLLPSHHWIHSKYTRRQSPQARH